MKKIFQKLLFIVPLVGLFSCGEKPDTSTPIVSVKKAVDF